MEQRVFRACEGLILTARVLSKKPEEAAMGAALALGRLTRHLPRVRLEALLDLARRSWEAAQ